MSISNCVKLFSNGFRQPIFNKSYLTLKVFYMYSIRKINQIWTNSQRIKSYRKCLLYFEGNENRSIYSKCNIRFPFIYIYIYCYAFSSFRKNIILFTILSYAYFCIKRYTKLLSIPSLSID